MIVVSVFVLLVLLHSLISRRLERTVITPPILFALGGILLLLAAPDPEKLRIGRHSFQLMAEIGLVMLLFTDATHIRFQALGGKGRLPLRLLSIGMLLSIVLGAVCARLLFPGLSLWEAGILGAILAPTDAGLGQVIVRSPRVPSHIRQALDVEAGLNDGLSVPFLMFFIAVAQYGTTDAHQVLAKFLFEQLGLGAAVGLGIGLAGGLLLGLAHKKGWMAEAHQQLGLVSLPLLCVLACKPTGGSMFIAAYVAGLAVQPGFPEVGSRSLEFTEGWGQLFDFFIFFYFGLVAMVAFDSFTANHLIYALLSLTLVRMLPVALALFGTRLGAASVLFMGWFGPRGLASIVLGLVFLEEAAHLSGGETIKNAVIATVLLSIFAHGLSAQPGIALHARVVETLDA